MACQETNGFNGSSIRPPVAEICQVAGRIKMSFKYTRSILVREQKTKRSNKSAYHRLLQVCMGNADMGRPPTLSRSRVLQIWPTNARFALRCTGQKTSLGNDCRFYGQAHLAPCRFYGQAHLALALLSPIPNLYFDLWCWFNYSNHLPHHLRVQF